MRELIDFNRNKQQWQERRTLLESSINTCRFEKEKLINGTQQQEEH